MACKIATYKRVVCVEWLKPEIADLGRIITALSKAHRMTGEKAIFIGRVREGSPPPADDVRAEMVKRMAELMEHCSATHAVMEGTGFIATIQRSAVSAIALATGKRKHFFVHSHAGGVATTAPSDVREEVSAALRYFEALGLISAPHVRVPRLQNLRSHPPPAA